MGERRSVDVEWVLDAQASSEEIAAVTHNFDLALGVEDLVRQEFAKLRTQPLRHRSRGRERSRRQYQLETLTTHPGLHVVSCHEARSNPFRPGLSLCRRSGYSAIEADSKRYGSRARGAMEKLVKLARLNRPNNHGHE